MRGNAETQQSQRARARACTREGRGKRKSNKADNPTPYLRRKLAKLAATRAWGRACVREAGGVSALSVSPALTSDRLRLRHGSGQARAGFWRRRRIDQDMTEMGRCRKMVCLARWNVWVGWE